MVGFGDDTIAVEVAIADTTETCTFLNSVVVYLVLTFEYAVSDIAHLRTYSMSDNGLDTVTTERASGGNSCRQINDGVGVMREVGSDVVLKAGLGLVAVAETKFNTHVIHSTGVHPLRSTFTHHTDAVHEYEDVLGLLIEPVERTI